MTDHLNEPGDVCGSGNAGSPPLARQIEQIELPASEYAPRLARQATREALASWLAGDLEEGDLEETAVLLVSELVTNAVRHARAAGLVLRLEHAGAAVRIEVHDADPRWPEPSIPAGLEESGFGFVLVAALAGKWGVTDTTAGKAVWVELPTR